MSRSRFFRFRFPGKWQGKNGIAMEPLRSWNKTGTFRIDTGQINHDRCFSNIHCLEKLTKRFIWCTTLAHCQNRYSSNGNKTFPLRIHLNRNQNHHLKVDAFIFGREQIIKLVLRIKRSTSRLIHARWDKFEYVNVIRLHPSNDFGSRKPRWTARLYKVVPGYGVYICCA